MFFLIYLVLGAAGAYVAHRKGYNDWWAVLLLVLLGVFGLVVILVLPKKRAAAALRTVPGIENALVGTSVTRGRQIGYKIVEAHVIDGTLREYNRQVYADVDLVLSNGESKHAAFEAGGTRFSTHWEDP